LVERTAKKVPHTNSTLLLLLKEKYQLCKVCTLRQADCATWTGESSDYDYDDDGKEKGEGKEKNYGQGRLHHCYICKGLFARLDEIADKALLAVKDYQFSNFLVGATLPTQLYEREDALRARLKIRGRENIKNQLTRELGTRLSELTKKKAEYQRPDVTINVSIDRDGNIEANARSRPLALKCSYIKRRRGLPQKSEKCPLCLGKGCKLCDGTGLESLESVEGIMAKHITKITGGQAPKFSWIGSEDQSSLVLGQGRPFYVKVSDPKVRSPRKAIKFEEADVQGKILQVLDEIPESPARFTVKTRLVCRFTDEPNIFSKRNDDDDGKHTVNETGKAREEGGEGGGEQQQGEVVQEEKDELKAPDVTPKAKTGQAKSGDGPVVLEKADDYDNNAHTKEKRDDAAIIKNRLKSLGGAHVKFENKNKLATKKIYSVHGIELDQSKSEFSLTLFADGGLPIKQFVGGEQYIEPSISSLLNAKCECVSFDILKVMLEGDPE
jgi:tRNA pseudouridine synthase 10